MAAKSPCLEILPSLFRDEQMSNRIQAYPVETMKRAYLELKGYYEQYKIYAEKLINFTGSINDENQRKEKLTIKLKCEYYAVLFTQASKLLNEYVNFRNRLVLELAINVNGLMESIHATIISRLSEDEKRELRRYCENIRSGRSKSKLQKKYIVCLLNDLTIEDLNYEGEETENEVRKVFYPAGMKISVYEDKALDLQKCESAKILKD
ncbi:conserved protein, unknown function [Hepatocystis sp. ex Piliocolobus tephrosceles]|nr:conserved protein, unknown function [Hepatocystis sp. ex Piliocolobus tephrosceles]